MGPRDGTPRRDPEARPWGGAATPDPGWETSAGPPSEWDNHACFFNILNYTVFSLLEEQEAQRYV